MDISHNTPCFSPKFCITFVADFSWVLQSSQQKIRAILMYFFLWGGGGRVKQGEFGRTANGDRAISVTRIYKFVGTKESIYIRIEFKYHRIGLQYQHAFHCFGTPYIAIVTAWKRSMVVNFRIETVWIKYFKTLY